MPGGYHGRGDPRLGFRGVLSGHEATMVGVSNLSHGAFSDLTVYRVLDRADA